jgi:hypothetical protein
VNSLAEGIGRFVVALVLSAIVLLILAMEWSR